MPIFEAIVGVWKVPVPKLLAVRHGSTVWRGCCCLAGWPVGADCLVVAWTRSTVNFVPVGTPAHGCVEDPRKSISKRFTLLVSNCPFDAVIVERACLGVRLFAKPIRRATGSTGHGRFWTGAPSSAFLSQGKGRHDEERRQHVSCRCWLNLAWFVTDESLIFALLYIGWGIVRNEYFPLSSILWRPMLSLLRYLNQCPRKQIKQFLK